MHGRYVVKELAVGFLIDRNSRPGLIRLDQSTSGVTEFVRHTLITHGAYMLHIVLTLANHSWVWKNCSAVRYLIIPEVIGAYILTML